ncbi:MAG: hypothetical protein CL916_15160, partial [Deltaproteobacteria bacterium]|nr:hypothetical protein [Deltaproteobacteria bacterium]
AEILFGYLFIGILAGLLIHIFMRLWFPTPPSLKKSIQTWFCFGLTVSLWWYLRSIIVQPCLHTYLTDMLPTVSDAFELWHVDGLGIIMSLSLLTWAFRKWPAQDRERFIRYSATIPLWFFSCWFILHNPAPEPPPKNTGVNLLIIGIDALRPDHLHRNGYLRETAPNLEALLDESVVFSNAFTSIARTYPSWVSILTGQWPHNNGIRDNLPHPDLLVPNRSNIAQEMQEAGWTTSFATDDSRFSYMIPKMGFDRIDQPEIGLKSFALSITEPRFRIFHGLLHNPVGFSISPVLRHNQAFGRSYRPELFNDAVVDLLAESAKKDRFMMAVHSCVLHAPGDRNYPWSRLYDQRGYQGKNRFRYSRSGTSMIADNMDEDDSVIDITHQDHNIYDSGMHMADAMIKQIVDELKRSGLWDNTVIVLLSDHGEEMFADELPYKYHGPNHGYHPYGDGQHHVMLGVRFPDGSFKGKEITDTVRLIDLAPTIAEHFSLDWDNEVDGKSLISLMKGEKEDEERLVYIETGVSEKGYWQKGHRKYPFPSLSSRYAVTDSGAIHVKKEFMEHIVQAKDRAVQLGRWKLVWRPTKTSGIVELYDRISDPLNLYNLAKQNPRIVAHLGLKMLPFLRFDGEKSLMFARWKLIEDRNGPPDLFNKSNPPKNTEDQ